MAFILSHREFLVARLVITEPWIPRANDLDSFCKPSAHTMIISKEDRSAWIEMCNRARCCCVKSRGASYQDSWPAGLLCRILMVKFKDHKIAFSSEALSSLNNCFCFKICTNKARARYIEWDSHCLKFGSWTMDMKMFEFPLFAHFGTIM